MWSPVEWKSEKQGSLMNAAPVLNGIVRLMSMNQRISIHTLNVAVKIRRPTILEVLAHNQKLVVWSQKGTIEGLNPGTWVEDTRMEGKEEGYGWMGGKIIHCMDVSLYRFDSLRTEVKITSTSIRHPILGALPLPEHLVS